MRRAALLLLAVIMLFSSCSKDVPDDSTPAGSEAEGITSAEDTAFPPPPETDEVTEEVTEEATDEITAEITEVTEPSDIELLGARDILLLTDYRADVYLSYIRSSVTTIKLDILGSKSYTETESELRVNDKNASFRRGGRDGFEYIYLVGDELYYESELGKCRVGGYDRASFLDFVSDSSVTHAFLGGEVREDGDEMVLSFSGLDENGRAAIISMLALPEGYSVSFGEAALEVRTDRRANLISSRMSVSLSVSSGGETLMEVFISTDTEQSDVGEDIALEHPSPEEYISFTDADSLNLYSSLIREIADFTAAHKVFEYSVRDSMLISSGSMRLPLTSSSVYSYNEKIGASIDKTFDNGDGTGTHTTLTHFNNSCGYSRIDNGSVFIDTTINSVNLSFTLAYPFTSSFFSRDNCIGMNSALSSGSVLVLDLNEAAAENIAKNLLLRAGVFSSSPPLSVSRAYTFIKATDDGRLSSVGYEFSATATVSGKTYTLTRSVELEILSREKANVKVIYCEPEEE